MRGGLVHQGLGDLYTGQQRQLAIFIKINANAQIDLFRIGVYGKLLVQA